MEHEIWHAVPGYEGHYEVSTCGRVRSLNRVGRTGRNLRGKVLRQRTDVRGYQHVNLWLDGVMTTHRIHRIVLTTFVGPAPEGTEGCHNDSDPANNSLENLRWDSHIENIRDKAPDEVRAGSWRASQGICMRGHQMKAVKGRYDCRPCRNERVAAKKAGRTFDLRRADARAQMEKS